MGCGLTKEDVQRLAFSLVEKMGPLQIEWQVVVGLIDLRHVIHS